MVDLACKTEIKIFLRNVCQIYEFAFTSSQQTDNECTKLTRFMKHDNVEKLLIQLGKRARS